VKFERNKLQEIQWRSLGNVGSLLQIDLYKGNTLNKTLSDTTLNDSLYNWMISADQEMGSDYRVRIQSHINSDVYAYSDTFDIIEYRRITITHPDTLNIQYKSGDDLPIQWTHSGAIGDEVMIELYKNGQFNFLITDNTENDGEYIWPIPIEQDTSSAYRIKVTALSDDTILDWSNNPFSILKDTGVENNPIPRTNQLYGNYPNPFNPETTVRYQIAQSTNVQVTIYNILGEKVKTLINAVQNEGQHEIQWKGRNDQGQGVASGVFIVELKAGEFTQRQKVMLIR